MATHKKIQEETRDKRLRFSIRKFNVGVASVAVAAFFMVSGGSVAAEEVVGQNVSPAATLEPSVVVQEDSGGPILEAGLEDQEAVIPESASTPEGENSQAEALVQTDLDQAPTSAPINLQPQAMTYKVVYRHAVTGEILYSEHRSLVLTDGQTKETATVSEVVDLSKVSGYKLADGQAATMTVTLLEVGRVVTFAVTEDEAAAPVTPTEGTGFRSAADGRVEIVATSPMIITEVNGAPATSLPTTGFTTTEPTPTNMNGTRNTVYHDASKFTFAALDLDATSFYLNNTTGAFQTSSGLGARRATQVTEIAFSTDEDGSGNVYAQFYAANGNLLKTETFAAGQNNEIRYGNDYRIYYSVRTENGRTYPTISFDKVTTIQGWFDEIYTNYATVLANTNGRYIGYGYFVPTLVDKVTDYLVEGTNERIGQVTQTQFAGYRYTTSAPDKILANGNTYELIPNRTISPTGRISNLVNVGDVLSVGTDANHVIRYQLLDATGRLSWQLLTPTGEVARHADSGARAEGILSSGSTADVTVVVPERVGNRHIDRGRVTYFINNPYFPGGRTIYYYRQTATAPKVAEVVHEFKSGTEGKELPQAVKDLLPPVKTNVAYDTTEGPVNPSSLKVEDGNDIWTFQGYDKQMELVDQPQEKFIGTWTVEAKTETVTETEEVGRTINYVTDTGEQVAPPFITKVTFTRTGTKNLVTGETTWGDWTPTNGDQTLEAQALPTKANYEATSTNGTGYDNISLTTVVANREVAAKDEDIVETVVYTPKTEVVTETEEVTRTINYVTDQGEPVADQFTSTVTFTRTGTKNLITGETIWGDWTPTNGDPTLEAQALPTKANYEATSTSGTGYDNISLTTVVANREVAAKDEDIVETVVYTPKTEAVTETEEVTRTINYVTNQGEPVADPFTSTVTFTRTGTKNLVTGETTWGDWTPTNGDKTLEAQPLPTKANYEATSTNGTGYDNISLATVVANRDAIATAEDIVETVVYTPKTETVTETEAVTRTINYVTNQGEPVADQFTSTVTFTRTGTKNLVTGETLWNDWTPTNGDQTLEAQALPTKANYEATSTSGTGYDNISLTTVIANREVAAKDEDIVETVVYTPKKRPNPPIIVPIGRKAQVIHEFVSGTPGKELPEEVKVLTPAPKSDVPYGGTEKPVVPSKTSVELADGTWTFTSYNKNRETVNQPTETFVGTWVFESKTETVTETEEVTRTINYVTDQGEPVADPFTSTVTFTRTGTKNQVTGETTWGDWTPTNGDQTLEAQALPTKANYEATSTNGTGYDNISLTTVVANREVAAKDEDIVETVVYTPKTEVVTETEEVTRTINYVTDQGEPVADQFTSTVTFTRTGTKNLITGETIWGDWTPTNGDPTLEAQALPTKANYEATSTSGTGYDNISLTTVVTNREVAAKDEDIVETVVYTPKTEAVTETEEVTRTINYVTDQGEPVADPFTSTVTFTRTGTKNLATGETTWGDWTPTNGDQTLESQALPTKANYEATSTNGTGYDNISLTTVIANREVAAKDEDIVETVVYTPKTETVTETEAVTRTINYVTNQGEPVADQFTSTVTFTRTGTKNLVTGETLWNDWTPTNGDQTLEAQALPTKANYEATSTSGTGYDNISLTTVIANREVAAKDEDIVETVVYTPKKRPNPPIIVPIGRKAQVIHEFVSGTPGKELPEEVKVLTPAPKSDVPYGGTEKPVAPTKTSVEIPEGTWTFQSYDKSTETVDKPEEKFTGTWVFTAKETPPTDTPVTTHVDENGNPVSPQEDGTKPVKTTSDDKGNTVHVYRPTTPPTETPVTTHVDENGNPVSPQEDGTKPVKEIPGYEPVKTTTDDKGNTVHVYRPVTSSTETPVTTHVDENGNPVSPQEDGTKPVKEIPGYEPVKTTTDDKGNTIHVYRPVTSSTETPVTTHVDENGNPVSPQEDGTKPVKEISGYEPVKTTTDGKGNITHVYRPTTPPTETPVTTHVDENGKPLLPQEDGTKPVREIPGYEPVKTTTDDKGNTVHVYRPVTPSAETPVTTYVDEQGHPILPPEGGNQPVGQIPGYEPVKTTTDDKGNTVHVYRPVTSSTETPITTHVDENGNPVSPQEDGTKPVREIPSYEPVKTTTDDKGNTIHVYRPTTPPTETPVTTHVDENGNPVSPQEDGTKPVREIPGYEPVKMTTDDKGNTVHVYRPTTPPTETPVTTHVDEAGKPVSPQEDGTKPVREIPGYEPVKTTTDGNGNTIHVYRPVTPSTETPVTTYVDEQGHPILPPEGGHQPVGQIPGYEPVKTTTDGNGNTIHVYRPVTPSTETPVTTHVDEQGHPILPPEGGNQPVGQIPGYEPVKTTTDGNGNTIHVYRPVTPSAETPVTTHVDEQGHPILPPEGGNQPVGQIPGYEPVKTTTDGNGNTIHVYRPVTPSTETPVTTHVDEQGHPILPPEGGNQPVGQIPGYEPVKTTTDGNGNTIHVYRPVTPSAETPVTTHVDEQGHPILPPEGGTKPVKEIPGYEPLKTTTDDKGNTIHVYRPTIPQPEQPVTPSNQPGQSIVERTGVPSHPTLPNTGDESSANLFAGYGLLSAAVAFGLVGRRRQDN